MRIKPYLLPLVQFALIGPGIGALTALLLRSDNGGTVKLSESGLLFLFSYGVGITPAVLAGVIYVSSWNARALFKSPKR